MLKSKQIVMQEVVVEIRSESIPSCLCIETKGGRGGEDSKAEINVKDRQKIIYNSRV